MIELEHHAKENADILFYVIDSQTRAVVVMIEVAYLVAKKRKVVLVISGIKGPGSPISNEPISQMYVLMYLFMNNIIYIYVCNFTSEF